MGTSGACDSMVGSARERGLESSSCESRMGSVSLEKPESDASDVSPLSSTSAPEGLEARGSTCQQDKTEQLSCLLEQLSAAYASPLQTRKANVIPTCALNGGVPGETHAHVEANVGSRVVTGQTDGQEHAGEDSGGECLGAVFTRCAGDDVESSRKMVQMAHETSSDGGDSEHITGLMEEACSKAVVEELHACLTEPECGSEKFDRTSPRLFQESRQDEVTATLGHGLAGSGPQAAAIEELETRASPRRICAQCSVEGQDMQRCARCKMAWYCSRSCQAAAWLAGHKAVCGGDQGGGEQPQPHEESGDCKVTSVLSGPGAAEACELIGVSAASVGADALIGEMASPPHASANSRPVAPRVYEEASRAEVTTSRGTTENGERGFEELIAPRAQGDEDMHDKHAQCEPQGSGQSARAVGSSGKSQGARAENTRKDTGKGFNIMRPPEGYDDPDIVMTQRITGVGSRATPTANLWTHEQRIACTIQKDRFHAAAAGSSGVGGGECVDPDASRHDSSWGSASGLLDGYNDPDFIISGGSTAAAGAHDSSGWRKDEDGKTLGCGEAWEEAQYSGSSADPATVVAKATRMLDWQFMKTAERLKIERGQLEEDLSAHGELQRAILAMQVCPFGDSYRCLSACSPRPVYLLCLGLFFRHVLHHSCITRPCSCMSHCFSLSRGEVMLVLTRGKREHKTRFAMLGAVFVAINCGAAIAALSLPPIVVFSSRARHEGICSF